MEVRLLDISLDWTDSGYVLKVNGQATPPRRILDFDLKIEPPDGEHPNSTLKITGGVDDHVEELLSFTDLSDKDLSEAKKKLLWASKGNIWKGVPAVWLAKDPKIYDRYMNHLERWVKHDQITRRIIFTAGVSAYSHNPLNLFVRGPSSIGKTYVVLQSLKYFPKKDVWLLGGMSPTALAHDFGTYVDESGNEIPYDENTSEKTPRVVGRYVVDLSNKILVFLEPPHFETYARLRPILSHDAPEIEFKFTDKTKRGSLRTKTVYVKGWPATVFCTVNPQYQEELATRSINMTPEMTEAKYRDAIHMQGEKSAQPWKYVNPDPMLGYLRMNIEEIKKLMATFEAVVPFGEEMSICYPHTQSRDMRDFSKLTTMTQQSTFLHIFQRPWLEGADYEGRRTVLSTLLDFREAIRLFSYVAETTRSGLPGNVVSFFNEVMVPLDRESGVSISYDEIVKKWSHVYGTTRSRDTLKRNFLDPLKQAGWVDEYPNPEDRRSTYLHVLHGPEESLKGFEKEFSALFNESRLEAWMAKVKGQFKDCRVMVGGVEVDWVEFPYRYFTEWV